MNPARNLPNHPLLPRDFIPAQLRSLAEEYDEHPQGTVTHLRLTLLPLLETEKGLAFSTDVPEQP